MFERRKIISGFSELSTLWSQFLGFVTGGDEALLGIIANNQADNWLHAVIAAGSLLVGGLLI